MSKVSYAPSGSTRPISEGIALSGVQETVVTEDTNGHNQPLTHHQSKLRSGSERFLIGTLYFGLIAWLICLISQAIVAAQISQEPVRILWFGIIIQFILTILILTVIIESATYDASYAYGTQISIFAALATVFAVIGVDQNIYSSESSQQATGAGWLLVAMIDLVWIIFFTSPPQSPIVRMAKSLTEPKERDEPVHQVEKIARSTDAFHPPLGNGHTRHEDEFAELTPSERIRAHQMVEEAMRERALNTPPEHRKSAKSAFLRRFTGGRKEQQASPDNRTTVVTEASKETSSPPVVSDVRSDGGSTAPDAPRWKAEAMYDYESSHSDPNEVSFKKGDILLIFDISGKWWEAQTPAGKKGIAPSNYLQLLNEPA